MFLSADLDIDVFVVVFVQRCHGTGVTEPEVGGVRAGLIEGDTGEGDSGCWEGGVEGLVFGGEVVVFFSAF